jgi:hypothetical protein
MQSEIPELMELCAIKPLSDFLCDPTDSQQLRMVLECDRGIDWRRCASVMAEDQGFSPSWPLLDGAEQGDISILYYLNAEDVFLLLATSDEGEKLRLSIVIQPELPIEGEKFVLLAQKLSNYFLHFVWSELLDPF